MKIDDASVLLRGDEQPNATLVLSSIAPGELSIIEIEPQDTPETVMATLSRHTRPVILLLPKYGTAFSEPFHFQRLAQAPRPEIVSVVIPRNRVATLAKAVYQQGFTFATSLEKAIANYRKQQPL